VSLSAVSKEFKISFTAYSRAAQIVFDDKNGNAFVLRDYDGTKDSRFGEHHVVAFLANTNKTFSFKNTGQ